MSRGYLARLLVWAGLIAGCAWLAVGWFAYNPEASHPRRHHHHRPPPLPSPADARSGEAAVFPYLTQYVNRPVAFARESWVFIAEAVILALLAWGTLARGLGVYDLIYAEAQWVRFANGLVGGLLLGNLLFVTYLINQDSIPWAVTADYTLFPVSPDDGHAGEATAVREAGNFLLVTWPPLLALVYAPGALRYGFGIPGTDRYPAVGVGMLSSVALTGLVVYASWRASVWTGGLVADWRVWYAQTPGAAAGRIDPEDYPLHLFASLITFVPLAGLALAGVSALVGRVACPVWVVCLLLWLFNSGYGFVTVHFAGMQYVLLVFAVAVVIVSNGRHPYKLSLPNLGPEYAAARRRDGPVVNLCERPAGPCPVPLLTGEELLEGFRERWQREHGTGSKPRLVVVAAAGGGVRSAVWTATVLEGLERAVGRRFGGHVRLITGSSGGMVAAGLYAAARVRPFRNPDLPRAVGEDSLWPTIQTMVIRDLPGAFHPFYRDWDRGRSLERAWHRNVPALVPGDRSPFRTTFAELLESEREGVAPSLIFSPLLVEDARRLLISNLDLADLAAEHAPTLTVGEDGKPTAGRTELSRSAFEFFRLFPAAHGRFEVGTAARMSATFPFVSPGVGLPTEPPRRVVDAGYFDNYGINLAALWLHRHREAVRRCCGGVAVVEVRGFPLEAEKTGCIDAEEAGTGPVGPVISALAGFSTPAEALVNSRAAGAYFRNDQLLGILNAEFNAGRDEPFFVRVPLECPGAAALSWSLTSRDRRAIVAHFHGPDGALSPEIAPRVRALAAWFGSGGAA